MIHFMIILMAAAGFASCSISMKRHKKAFEPFHLSEGQMKGARMVGYMLLGATLFLDMIFLGPARGAIIWFGHLTIGAGLMAAFVHIRS